MAADADRAFVGPVKSGKDPNECGLAGAVGTEQRMNLSRSQREVYPTKRMGLSEESVNSADLDKRRAGNFNHVLGTLLRSVAPERATQAW